MLQKEWPPANFESIPAQAVVCARFTSKARFYLEIRDQIIYVKLNLINKLWNNDQIKNWFTPWDTAQSNEYFRIKFFFPIFFSKYVLNSFKHIILKNNNRSQLSGDKSDLISPKVAKFLINTQIKHLTTYCPTLIYKGMTGKTLIIKKWVKWQTIRSNLTTWKKFYSKFVKEFT